MKLLIVLIVLPEVAHTQTVRPISKSGDSSVTVLVRECFGADCQMTPPIPSHNWYQHLVRIVFVGLAVI